LTYEEVYARIRARFPEVPIETPAVHGEPFAIVPAAHLKAVALFLRDDPELRFDFPSCQSGTDDGTNLWSVYHLYSIPKNHRAVLKVKCERQAPSCPSLVDVWPGMNWHERETYDMYGIRYEGHPDLRRILLPEDWPGYPLRKDYAFPDEYQGIPLR
jgi:NADH-quinone oxidoreductase subunit C